MRPKQITYADVLMLLDTLKLDEISVRDVYRAGCEAWGVRVNKGVVGVLPELLGGFEAVVELDFSGCYVGGGGVGGLLPVLTCCERLRDVVLAGNGVGVGDLKVLFEVFVLHPSLENVDLSRNELATSGGVAALRLVESNVRIKGFGCNGSLVIPALQRKISSRTTLNKQITPPMQRFQYVTSRMAGKTPANNPITSTKKNHSVAEDHPHKLLPYWFPAAAKEFCEILAVHEAHLDDIVSIFPGDYNNNNSTACTPSELISALSATGSRFPTTTSEENQEESPQQKIEEFAQILGVLDDDKTIRVFDLISALRLHTCVAKPPTTPYSPGLQSFLDLIYDKRQCLTSSFTSICTEGGRVTPSEFVTGVSSLRPGSVPHAEEFLTLTGAGEDLMINFTSVLHTLAPTPREPIRWEKYGADEVKDVVAALRSCC